MCSNAGGGGGAVGGEKGTFSRKDLEKLEKLGGKRWTKGDKDRMYLSKMAYTIGGLEIEQHKTGSIAYATFDGEKISNSEASRALVNVGDMYIDLKTGGMSRRRLESKYTVPQPREMVQQRIFDYVKNLRKPPKKK